MKFTLEQAYSVDLPVCNQVRYLLGYGYSSKSHDVSRTIQNIKIKTNVEMKSAVIINNLIDLKQYSFRLFPRKKTNSIYYRDNHANILNNQSNMVRFLVQGKAALITSIQKGEKRF